MSISSIKKLEIAAFKPKLENSKFKLGDLVTDRGTPERVMLISDLCPLGDISDPNADYCACWISPTGKLKEKPFTENELKHKQS